VLPRWEDREVLQVTPEQFDGLVADALDTIPAELASLISNCVVLVDEDVPEGSPSLLGRYEGIPLTERGDWYSGVLPDRIILYRRPILSICRTLEEVVAEVRITVVHEVAHHFGIGEERLHELGWG
jgi:predicted Zn-dependent protease with MMP-like domain